MLKHYTVYLHMTVKSGVRHMCNSESRVTNYRAVNCLQDRVFFHVVCTAQNMVPLKTATNNCNSSLIFSAVLVAALYL